MAAGKEKESVWMVSAELSAWLGHMDTLHAGLADQAYGASMKAGEWAEPGSALAYLDWAGVVPRDDFRARMEGKSVNEMMAVMAVEEYATADDYFEIDFDPYDRGDAPPMAGMRDVPAEVGILDELRGYAKVDKSYEDLLAEMDKAKSDKDAGVRQVFGEVYDRMYGRDADLVSEQARSESRRVLDDAVSREADSNGRPMITFSQYEADRMEQERELAARRRERAAQAASRFSSVSATAAERETEFGG